MKTRRGMVEYGNPFCFYAVEPELGAYQTGDWCHRMAQVQRVNAGEKMHRRTEVIMHRDGPPDGAPLSSSIDQPAFPVPTWHHLSHGAQRRGWEERSHAQQREHGEHRTFLAVSTVAG